VLENSFGVQYKRIRLKGIKILLIKVINVIRISCWSLVYLLTSSKEEER